LELFDDGTVDVIDLRAGSVHWLRILVLERRLRNRIRRAQTRHLRFPCFSVTVRATVMRPAPIDLVPGAAPSAVPIVRTLFAPENLHD
jgi:hypothetical protein